MSISRFFLYPLAAVLFAGAACATLGSAEKPNGPDGRIEVVATPVALDPDDPAVDRLGRLIYRGGLVLSSADGRFGGISGLRWQAAQNRLLAVTDRGDWLAIATDEKDGRLTGLGGVEIGRLTGADGQSLKGKRVSDAEALALTQGAALITFENDHRIASYDLDADGVPAGAANPGPIPADDWFAVQRGNGGVEALATYAGPGGRAGYILLSEDLRDARGRSRGVRYSVGPNGAVVETALSLPILDPLRPTDAAANEETLFVLARSFSPLRGVEVELLAFDLDTDLVESERLAAFRPPLTIDNMEGLALRTVAGRTYIYMVSDDNFSPLQRTLLLKFEVTG